MQIERPRRVAVYSRVSTASDLQDGSFEVQKEYYKKKIQSDPTLILADVFGDQGKSGRSIKARTEFQRMMQDCEEGRIVLILTKSISRFSPTVTGSGQSSNVDNTFQKRFWGCP